MFQAKKPTLFSFLCCEDFDHPQDAYDEDELATMGISLSFLLSKHPFTISFIRFTLVVLVTFFDD